MDNLSFKEKIALKMLIKHNRLEDHVYNGTSLINKISLSILFNNMQFLEEVILKGIADGDSLEYEIYLLIETTKFEYMSESQLARWEQLKLSIYSRILSSNIYAANDFQLGFDIVEVFKKIMQEKIENNEIDRNCIDKISEMLSGDDHRDWLPITISLLKESGKEDLFLYAVEKMQAVLITQINQQDISSENKSIVSQSINQSLKRYIRGGIKYEDLI